MRGWRFFLTAAILLVTGVGASGYALLQSKWRGSTVTMHLELGSSGTLIDGSSSWNAAAATALSVWNYYLRDLQFVSVVDSLNPGDNDGANNVFFGNTIYGSDFGDAVAVTTEWDDPGNSTQRKEADVILNAALSWNSYRGSLRRSTAGSTIYDIRRVLLHEFGHVLGLDHPDEAGQSVTAIMNSRVSSIDALQADDVRGGQSLYGAQPGTLMGPLADIERPIGKTVVTTGKKYYLAGTADPYSVQSVYLVNTRLGSGRFFKTKGVATWRAALVLKRGRNLVRLYVADYKGVRQKVTERVIFKR